MGNFSFPRLIGSRADLNELEYVIALHQTCFPSLRTDATISSKDIALFLRSRYGFIIDRHTALDIIRGLGGTTQKIPDNTRLSAAAAASREDSTNHTTEHQTAEQIILQQLGFQGRNYEERNQSLRLDEVNQHDMGKKRGVSEQDDLNVYSSHNRPRTTSSNLNSDYESNEHLDLVHLYSSLLIPSLLKATRAMIDDESAQPAINPIVTDARIGIMSPTVNNTASMSLISLVLIQLKIFLLSLPDIRLRMREAKEREVSLRIQPSSIISDVLRILLAQHLSGDTRPKYTTTESCSPFHEMSHLPHGLPLMPSQSVPLTKALIRHLLLQYGERETARDDLLLEEMVQSAGSDDLTVEAFARALTSDIECWETGVEDSISTTFYDVFKCEPDQFEEKCKGTKSSPEYMNLSRLEQDGKESFALKVSPLSPSIDYVFDMHYSDFFVVILWLYYLFSVTIYLALAGSTEFGLTCTPGFWCSLIKQMLLWLLVALMLTCAGVIIIFPMSLGNSPYPISVGVIFFSCIYLVTISVVPIFFFLSYAKGIPHSTSGTLSQIETIITSPWLKADVYICLSFGVLLLLLLIPRCFTSAVEVYAFMFQKRFQKLLRSSHLTRSSIIKEAATHKINSLLINARNLHLIHGSSPLVSVNIDRFELWTGVFSAWKVLSENERHGIWVHSRLIIGQMGQIIAFFVFVVVVLLTTENSARYYDLTRQEVLKQPNGALRDWILRVVPESWVLRRSCYTGLGFAIVDGIALMLIYVPSTVTTIMKFRCGFLPSLRDNQFTPKYRGAVDTITYNVGGIIFGMLGSQGLFFLFFGGLVFLFLWPVTSYYMALIAAWFIGLMVTICLKVILMAICRKAFFAAMFRTHVRSANFSALAMEAWNLALAGGSVLSRLSQFLLASAFWLGRVDCFLLDQDVNLFGYRFDFAPLNYRKEILVHEAHKHPFMDRLAGVYLTRLKHGRAFCSNAGVVWRRLFVLALNPWLLKYRCEQKIEKRS